MAIILAMIGVLMLAHLGMLYVGIKECDAYADLLLERVRNDPTYEILPANSECSDVEESFASAVSQYLTVFLSLLGGSAITAVGNKV